jgi:hypothetical protein
MLALFATMPPALLAKPPGPLDYYERACKDGEPRACFYLGHRYDIGFGVPRDLNRAAELYGQACEGGRLLACHNLAVMFHDGVTISADLAKAAALYRSACDKGAMVSCNNLGIMYDRGEGGAKDTSKATQLFARACKGKMSLACTNLGISHLSAGTKGLRKAALRFEEGCTRGDPGGCNHVGQMYRDGHGVERDAARSVKFFERACEGRYSWGCFNLAWLHLTGTGVPVDLWKAGTLYDQACKTGLGAACTTTRLQNGNSLERTRELRASTEDLRTACSSGDGRSCSEVARRLDSENGSAKDYAASARFYEEACDAGYAKGCTGLANMYFTLRRFKLDIPRASAFYDRGCQGGDLGGCYHLGLMSRQGLIKMPKKAKREAHRRGKVSRLDDKFKKVDNTAPDPDPRETASCGHFWAPYGCMVRLPGGAVMIGAQNVDPRKTHYDPKARADESPVHGITLTPFWMHKEEVTCYHFAKCVADGACPEGSINKTGGVFNYGIEDRRYHPANGVTWDGAQSYCRWIGARLPTEAEWEHAAA